MTTETTQGDAGTTNPSDAQSPATGGAPAQPAATQGNAASGTEQAAGGNTEGQQGGSEQGSNNEGEKGDEPVVPEKYEFKMPAGVELDKAAADEFSTIAKELKLPQEAAQKVADIAVKMQQRQAERHIETVKGWVEQCKTDKEFGGDNLERNLSVARKAIDTFGSPELKALLNQYGLGSHPELVRFAFKAGKAIDSDKFVPSGTRSATPESTSLEKRLYPDMN